MESQLPKLRDDLIISRQENGDEVIYIVKDEASDRFFRFKEVEGFILTHLDGKEEIENLRVKVEREFKADLPRTMLNEFLATLQNRGLLVNSGSSEPVKRTSKRIQGDPFYLRVKLFDPNALFDRLLKPLSFFFTRSFLVFSGLCIVLGIATAMTSMPEITRDVYALFQSFSLVVAYVIVLSVVMAHEFAHGMTCKRFGGNVHEIGFLLLYFMPAFYCNVSDSWLFPEKSKRLWVTFAGAYFEIFLWAVSALAWRVTEVGTIANSVALVILATSGVKTLFNLNPLIKLDGYYLLSDYLDIPNLRSKAFTFVADKFKNVFGSTVERFKDITSREKRIFVVYGLLAGGYTAWILSVFFGHFGNYLMTEYRGWGFLLFSAFIVSLFRNQFRKLFQGIISMTHLANKLGYLKKPPKILYGIALAALLFFFRMQLSVSGQFVILPVHNADVRSEVEEIITEVYVDEGDTVQAGDPVVRLSDRQLTAELNKITAQIAETEAQLRLLQKGPRREEIELARTLVAKADERLSFSSRELQRDSLLFQRQIVSEKELDRAREVVAVRKRELEEETKKLNVLLLGTRREEIQAMEAAMNRLSEQRKFLEAQLQLLTVRSPATGVVTTPKLKEKLGQEVKKGDLIAKVFEQRTVIVEIPVPEKDISDVHVGQDVLLKARSYPHLSFSGAVTAIAPVAIKEETWSTERTFTVKAALDNSSGMLKAGMSGNAKIYCGERRLYELLLRGILRFFRVEVWSWF